MRKLITILSVLTLLLTLLGCSNEGPSFYTVTFDTDGGLLEVESQYIKKGSKVVEPKDPVKENCMFREWRLDGVKYDFSSPITSDITLKAEYWTIHIVDFDTDGGSFVSPMEVIEGTALIEPAAPVKKGTGGFAKWVKVLADGTTEYYDFSKEEPVTEDMTLRAVYIEAQYYTVSFDSNGGSSTSSQILNGGDMVVQPRDPSKKNTYFKEWVKVDSEGKASKDAYNFNEPVTESFTLKAVYYTTYTVTIFTQGGSSLQNDVQYVKEGGYAVEPKTPVNETKWGFKEWLLVKKDGSTSSFDFASTKVTSDLTIKADYWDKYTVIFKDADGKVYSTQEVKENTKAMKIDAPSKSGAWSFKSWVIEGKDTEYDFDSPVVSDITLVPTYINGYTVTFDSDGGSTTPSQILKEGEKVIQPRDPSKENASFKKWVKVDSKGGVSEDAYNFNDPVTESFTLKAVYDGTYTVKILSDDGSVSIQYVKEGDYAVEPKTPVNETKWGFKEWLLVKADGSTSSFDFASTKVTSDLTIRADYWEKYTVTFKDTYGDVYSTQTVKENTKAVKIDAPSRSGAWSFKCWVLEGTETEYNFDSAVVSDITLVATYFNGYTVTFDSDGGTYTPEKQFVKEGEKASEPKSPDKSGTKGFMWWTKDGKYYDFSTPVTSDITLKAVYWKAATADRETYDQDVINLKNEVRCLHNITRTLLNNTYCKDLMNGATDIKSIFSISDDGSSGDTAKYLFANMRMNEDRLVINGERYTLDNVNMKIDLTMDSSKKITKNASSIVQGTGYTIDIEGLTFETMCYPQVEGKPGEKLTSTMSVKGTVIKHSDERYEFHLQFTIVNNGIETVYPVIHAGAIKSGKDGDDNILFYSFRGYTGYIPNITLW